MMRNSVIIFLIILLSFSVTLSNELISPAYAEHFPEGTTLPVEYDIRITVLDIGKIDLSTGSYDVTFWLTITNEDFDMTIVDPPMIDFVNGHVNYRDFETTKSDEYYAKINAQFYTNMEFRNYPLGHIDLPIIMEPAHHENDEIIFVQTGVPSSPIENFQVLGWIMHEQDYDVTEFQYPTGDSYTRFVANFGFDTPFISGFMVGIFPIIVMGAVVLLSFLIDPTLEIRPEIVTATLIAAVFFHVIDIGEGLPPLEYLTLEDKLMTTLYALIMFAMVEIATQRKYNEGKMEKAEAINKKFRFMIPILLVGTFAAAWWL